MKILFNTILLALIGGFYCNAQSVDSLRLQFGSLNYNETASTLCAMIQISSFNQGDFTIGTSSIFLTYNPNVLDYQSYTSQNFDGSSLCIEGIAPTWIEHQWDAISIPGVLNLTCALVTNEFSCPNIAQEWVDVGEVCFDVTNNSDSPNLDFDANKTSFNNSIPNNGSNEVIVSEITGVYGSDIFDTCSASISFSTNETTSLCPQDLPISIQATVETEEAIDYEWSTGENTANIQATAAGTYTLNVAYGNLCTGSATTTIEVLASDNQACVVETNNSLVNKENISIYPNITNEQITLQFSDNIVWKNAKAKIYDTRGNLVKSLIINDSSTNIDVENFAVGNYLIQIIGNDIQVSERFVKIK